MIERKVETALGDQACITERWRRSAVEITEEGIVKVVRRMRYPPHVNTTLKRGIEATLQIRR